MTNLKTCIASGEMKDKTQIKSPWKFLFIALIGFNEKLHFCIHVMQYVLKKSQLGQRKKKFVSETLGKKKKKKSFSCALKKNSSWQKAMRYAGFLLSLHLWLFFSSHFAAKYLIFYYFRTTR